MSYEAVDSAIEGRMSVRAFADQKVEHNVIESILKVASRAPSGTNCQPWRVYVLEGETRQRLVDQVCATHDAVASDPSLAAQHVEAYDYYPTQWVSPYIDRRRECGFGLYGVLGIGKGDKEKCTFSTNKIFGFLVRRWAYFLPSTKSWAAVVCSITACSFKVSCWLRERADCTHAHRPHGIVLEKLFSNTLARATTK